jgi:hypothetical protein
MIGYPPSLEKRNELGSLPGSGVTRQDHLVDATLANRIANGAGTGNESPRTRAETQEVQHRAFGCVPWRGVPTPFWYRGQIRKFSFVRYRLLTPKP